MKRSGLKRKPYQWRRSTRPLGFSRKPMRAKRDHKMEAVNREIRERDHYTCQWPDCWVYSKQIPVHHIQERSQRPDLKYQHSNLVCICPQHHDRLHHTVAGRREAREQGLLGGETFEAARKVA